MGESKGDFSLLPQNKPVLPPQPINILTLEDFQKIVLEPLLQSRLRSVKDRDGKEIANNLSISSIAPDKPTYGCIEPLIKQFNLPSYPQILQDFGISVDPLEEQYGPYDADNPRDERNKWTLAFHYLPSSAESEVKKTGGIIGVKGRRTFHILDDDDYFKKNADLPAVLERFSNNNQLPDTEIDNYLLVYLAPSALVFLTPLLPLSLFKPDIQSISQLPEPFVQELVRTGRIGPNEPDTFVKELTFLPDSYRIGTYPHYTHP